MQSMNSAPARIGKTTGKASTKPVSKTIMADKGKYPGLINR